MLPEILQPRNEFLQQTRFLQVFTSAGKTQDVLVFWDVTSPTPQLPNTGDHNSSLYATVEHAKVLARHKTEIDLQPSVDENGRLVQGVCTVDLEADQVDMGTIRRIYLSDGSILEVKSMAAHLRDFEATRNKRKVSAITLGIGALVTSLFWQLSPLSGGADIYSAQSNSEKHPVPSVATIHTPKPLPAPSLTPETTTLPSILPTPSPTPSSSPETSSPLPSAPAPTPTPSKTPEAVLPPKPITTDVYAATWNMYYKNKGNVGESVKTLLKTRDLVFLQEANRHRKALLRITENSSKYGLIQEKTSQYRNAMVFNTDKFALRGTSSFKAAQDGRHKRFINTAFFTDKKTNQEIIAINVHAPFSVDDGGKPTKNKTSVTAYKKFMDELTKWVEKLQHEHPLAMMMVAGDFNVANGPDSKKCSTDYFPCAGLGPFLDNGFADTKADDKGATHGKTRDIDIPYVGSPSRDHADGLAATIHGVEIHQKTKKKAGWGGSDHSAVFFTVTGVKTPPPAKK